MGYVPRAHVFLDRLDNTARRDASLRRTRFADCDTFQQAAVRYGPLVPPQKTTVPMWYAATLKKKKKCRIVVPSWLAVCKLTLW